MPIVFIDGVPVEMIGFEGTPPPQKRVRVKNPGSRSGLKKIRLGNRDYTTPGSREKEKCIGGYDFGSLRNSQINSLFNNPGFPSNSRAGVPDGMKKKDAIKLWVNAKEQARKDMDIIKRAFPETDAIVEEATMQLLTNLRGPSDDGIKTTSAKILLDFYKAKPTAKKDITVNSFETWLSTIDEDKSD